MKLTDRILVEDQGPFKRGLEVVDQALYFLLGDPLLAIVDTSNDDLAYDKLSEIAAFTETTNVKFEVLTSLHFCGVESNLLDHIELYYVCYEDRTVEMDYLDFRNGQDYNEKLVSKIIFDILPTQQYPWINLKGSKKLDSNIYYIKSNQTETVCNKLCFKHLNNFHPLLDRLTLKPVLND